MIIHYIVPPDLEKLFTGKDPVHVITAALKASTVHSSGLSVDQRLDTIRNLLLEVALNGGAARTNSEPAPASSEATEKSKPKPKPSTVDLSNLTGDAADAEILSMIFK